MKHLALLWAFLFVVAAPCAMAQDDDAAAPTLTLTHGDAPVVSAAWSPNGTQIATTGEDATIRVWSAETGEEHLHIDMGDYEGYYAPKSEIEWSGDGDTLRLSWFGHLLVLSAETGEVIWHIDYGTSSASMPLGHRWSHDGRYVVTYAPEPEMKTQLIDAATGKVIDTLDRDFVMYWSPDDTRVLTLWSGIVYGVTDAGFSDEPLCDLEHEYPAPYVYWSHDSTRILTMVEEESKVYLWDAETAALLWASEHEEGRRGWEAGGGGWNLDDSKVMSISHSYKGSRSVRIWDTETGGLLGEIVLERVSGWNNARWSESTDRLLVWGQDGYIYMWDGKVGEVTFQKALPEYVPEGAEEEEGERVATFWANWSADERYIGARDAIGRLGAWETETGSLVLMYTDAHQKPHNDLLWNPTTNQIAVIDRDLLIFELPD